jgi:formylmethanofuran dehydrogenase subunit B
MSEKIRVTCPFCSLHCADLRLTLDGGRLVGFSPDCTLGENGYRGALKSRSRPDTRNSLQAARALLRAARQPLVVLSGSLDGEAVSAVVRLAKRHSSILACDEDLTGSVLALSTQAAGLLTATLGDLRGLSLAVLCGVDPARTQPRLGEFLGRDLAVESLRLEPPDPLEALRWLRLAALGAGDNLPAVYSQVAARIAAVPTGVVVFGPKWLKAGQPFTTELLLWLKDLNREKRWYALYLAPGSNSTGVVETLLSETGSPGNLRFGPEGPDYSPRLWRAERLLEQGIPDLCLLAGRPGAFSEKTLARLSQTRTILLDPDPPAWTPTVWLPAARGGVEAPGLVQRLDSVPVELLPVISSRHMPIKDLLLELSQVKPA